FEHYSGNARYDKGLCPTAERLHEKELMFTGVVRFPATYDDMDDIAEAIQKVAEQKESLCRMVCA
ncbi:MAG: hypothetical protein ACRD4H_09670, partial [Candidatus Acidiferrales bacterium]